MVDSSSEVALDYSAPGISRLVTVSRAVKTPRAFEPALPVSLAPHSGSATVRV